MKTSHFQKVYSNIGFIHNFIMKNLIFTFLVLLTVVSLATAQSEDKWEKWAENLAEQAERLAEQVGATAERSAEHLAIAAEDLAANIEEKIERGDFDIHFNDLPDGVHFSSLHNTAYLGIHSDHISKEKAEKLGFKNKYGSYVSKVVKNSSAEKAGLRPFDYIYGVEDQRTSNNQDLTDILADYEPGEKVKLYFVRSGQEKTVEVELGDYDDFDWEEDRHDDAFLGVRPSSHERRNDMDGVTINVIHDTAAEEMGLEDDDIIKAINGYPVLDWDDVTTVLDNLKPGDKVNVLVKRGDREVSKSGNVEKQQHDNKSISFGKNDSNWKWDWEEEEWGTTKGAFLGVYLEHLSEKKAKALGFDNPYGSYVSSVIKNTAAEKAGIKPFDYIFGIDEYRVGEEQNLGGILRKYEPGDEATVHFYRKGKKTSKPVIFRPRTDATKEYKNKCEDPFFGIVELEKESGQTGVRIKPVNNSTAKELGLEEDDIITHINGYQMYDWTDIGIAINMLSPGDKISVDYTRDGKKMSGSKSILSYAKTKNCKDCDCDELGHKLMYVDPDISIVFPNKSKKERHDTEPRIDVDEVNIALENITENEARNLGSKGVNMEISNDLRVDNLKLAPNPNIGMFELQFDLDTQGETMVKVYNPAGRAIYEYDLGRFSGDFSDYIDISQNGPGTYFLQISQSGKSFVRKVVLTTD